MIVPTVPLPEIVLRTVIVYVAVFALLRIAGKRELGQMSVADLVVILVISVRLRARVFRRDQNQMTGIELSPSELRDAFRPRGRDGVRLVIAQLQGLTIVEVTLYRAGKKATTKGYIIKVGEKYGVNTGVLLYATSSPRVAVTACTMFGERNS